MPDTTAPTICYASATGPNGAVFRGPECNKDQAVAYRQAGNDVVVCDGSRAENRQLAQEIEELKAGAGNVLEHRAHTGVGPYSLPHFQPRVRPPRGHTFFETRTRKAMR